MRYKAIDLLIKRALSISHPYQARALANIYDAERDLSIFPEYANKIIADCQRAVAKHETDAKEEQR